MIPAVVSTGQRLRTPHVEESELPPESARSPAVEIFLWSRGAIWLAAVFAFLVFEPNRHPQAARWDSPLIHDLGWPLDWRLATSDFARTVLEARYLKAPPPQ